MSVEEVLADKLIVWPITRSMCAPMSDGAAAVIIASADAAARLGDSRRAVRIRGIGVSSGSNRKPGEVEKHLTLDRVAFSPVGLPGGWVSSQAWFVCRPRSVGVTSANGPA